MLVKKLKLPILYLVLPCYNEEEILPLTKKTLEEEMSNLINNEKISNLSKVMFVNDGSKDKTWSLIKKYHEENSLFAGISLSRNKGHQNALLAGLMVAKEKSDIVISMDADLQDDISVISKMIDAYKEGNEIVYGVRESRQKDTWFKRNSAELFYKLMKMMGVEVVYNHADCRLMSKKALDGLEQFQEVNLFLRGIVPLIGYQSSVVYYPRNQRVAGESKYPFKKMLNFALEGITSFSVKPLRLIIMLGLIITIISFLFLVTCLISKFTNHFVSDLKFILLSIWFIGGLLMLCIGLVGEYIGKIYNEVKKRPRYIIKEELL